MNAQHDAWKHTWLKHHHLKFLPERGKKNRSGIWIALNFPKAIFWAKRQWEVVSKFWRKIIYNLKFYTLPNYLPSVCIKWGQFQTCKVWRTCTSYVPFKSGRRKTGDTSKVLKETVRRTPDVWTCAEETGTMAEPAGGSVVSTQETKVTRGRGGETVTDSSKN